MSQRILWSAKHSLRRTARWVFWRSGLAAATRRPRAVVLALHTVGDPLNRVYPGNVISSGRFELLLTTIRTAGYRVVPLDEVVRAHEEKRADSRILALTFDDGYRGCLDTVAPALATRQASATFFVSTGFIDRQVPKWDDLLFFSARPFDKSVFRKPQPIVDQAVREAEQASPKDRLEELANALLGYSGLTELRDSGFSIQAHGVDHYSLATQSTDLQAIELGVSKTRLEQELGIDIEFFAYPFGSPESFDETTKTLARAAGYRAAFSVADRYVDQATDSFEIPRFGISEQTPKWLLELILSGRHF